MICLVTVGLTASLFVLTVIGWFPDLYSTSKYIGQVLTHSAPLKNVLKFFWTNQNMFSNSNRKKDFLIGLKTIMNSEKRGGELIKIEILKMNCNEIFNLFLGLFSLH